MTDIAQRIEQLRERNVFLTWPIGGEDVAESPALAELLACDFLDDYSAPAVIDMTSALKAYSQSGDAERSLLRARIRFQGTDGIRGKIDQAECDDYLKRFVRQNTITPSLVRNNCYSFAELLIDRAILSPGDAVLVGEDGRDLFGDGVLSAAMKDGFCAAGLVVHDLGLSPTPEIPYQMLTAGTRAGAALTASHNPSNQNGLKFFLDGKKLLPEGEVGDFTLSAYQYKNSLSPLPAAEAMQVCHVPDDKREAFVDFIIDSLPPVREKLSEIHIVCDAANGAFSKIAPAVLIKLGADARIVNAEPTGDNINQGGGVAELEGTARYDGRVDEAAFADYLPSIRAMFEQGRSSDKPVFGLAFDGDGDRGYVLAYDRDDDALIVVDGDRAGFIIARSLAARDENASEKYFLSTVESDLMTDYYVGLHVGCKTEICPVGDKWLSTFTRGPVLMAEESSGHAILPSPVATPDGSDAILMTGNGLQAALMLLCCVLDEGLTVADLARPFPAGLGKTHYVYNVDRSLLANGSDVWNADVATLKSAADTLTAAGELLAGYELRLIEKAEDPDMLFAALIDGEGRTAGTIFARNSGTEVKTATYYRCKPGLEGPLSELADAVNRNHITMMKDEASGEFQMERAILAAIEAQGTLTEDQAIAAVTEALGKAPGEAAVRSVLYGLRKEGRIRTEEGRFVAE